MYTSYKIENDTLVITCDAETQKELQELGEAIQQDKYMFDCFEHIICNGLSWVRPEDIGALTSAPILSEGTFGLIGHWGGKDRYEKSDAPVFYYESYALKSPLVDLRDKGVVIFHEVAGFLQAVRAS